MIALTLESSQELQVHIQDPKDSEFGGVYKKKSKNGDFQDLVFGRKILL